MRELAKNALDSAQAAGASYADVRVARYLREAVSAREQRVTNISSNESFGVGVRVLVDGTWGFAGTQEVSKAGLDRAIARAIEIAKANRSAQREPVRLAPVKAYKDTWQTPITKDPFRVPLERKIELLLAINAEALKVKGAAFSNSSLSFVKEDKLFVSTDGSEIDQVIIRSQPTFTVTAVDRQAGKFRTRNSLAEPLGAGWEYVESWPWLEEAHTAAEQAVQKLSAKSVEAGRYDLILKPTNLWLTIHESVGHPTDS